MCAVRRDGLFYRVVLYGGCQTCPLEPSAVPKALGPLSELVAATPLPPRPARVCVCTRVSMWGTRPHLLGLHCPCSGSQPSISPPLGRCKNVRDPWTMQPPHLSVLSFLPPVPWSTLLPRRGSRCPGPHLVARPSSASWQRRSLPEALTQPTSSLLCNLPWLPCLQNQVYVISCWIPPDANPETD